MHDIPRMDKTIDGLAQYHLPLGHVHPGHVGLGQDAVGDGYGMREGVEHLSDSSGDV